MALGSDTSFTYAFTAFMVMFMLEPANVLREMYRVLSQGISFAWRFRGERLGIITLGEEACQSLDSAYILLAPFNDPNEWRTLRLQYWTLFARLV